VESDDTFTPAEGSMHGVVLLDRSVDQLLLGQMPIDPHASFLRGADVSDEWDEAPFVAARRLADAVASTAPFAGDAAMVAVGDHARFVEPASVKTLRMSVLYGTNFHQGLVLARARNPNRILVIAYSSPTAHWVGPHPRDHFFAYPPCTETLKLTKRELDGAVDDGVRIDAVLIDDPARPENYFEVGRLQEMNELAADATFRSHGLLAHIDTPASDEVIADIVHALTNTAQQ
jgi:hypothetical protein